MHIGDDDNDNIVCENQADDLEQQLLNADDDDEDDNNNTDAISMSRNPVIGRRNFTVLAAVLWHLDSRYRCKWTSIIILI